MGSSTMLDFISSLIIGGFLMFMVMRLDAQAREASSVDNMNLMVQENMTSLVQMLQTDLGRIGYCQNPDDPRLSNPTDALRYAGPSKIMFYTDTQNNGNLDSVSYWIGPTTELDDTPNPRDRFLYRQVNTTAAVRMNLGVTQFAFRYFDAMGNPLVGNPLPIPQMVSTLELTVSCESPQYYKQEFNPDTAAFYMMWRQLRLSAMNLRNR